SWHYENFRAQIQRYADQAKSAYDETDRECSIAKWQESFGPEFAPGVLGKVASLSPLSATVPWKGEDFIARHFPLQLQPQYRVRVSGRCLGYRTGRTTRRQGFRQFD